MADYEHCWWHCNIVHGYYEGTGLIAIDTDTVACSKCIASKKSLHEAWFSGQDFLDRGDHHCQACFGQGSSNPKCIEKELVLSKAGKGMRKGSDKSSGSGKSNDGKGLDKSSGKSDSGKGFHSQDDRAPQELRQVGLRQGLPLTLAGRTPTRFPASWPLKWAYVDSDQSDDVSCQSPAGGSRHVQSDDGTDSSSGDVSSYDSTDTSSSDRSRSPQRLTRTQPSVPSEIHQDVATERPSSEDIKNTLAYLSEVWAVRSK